jgi:glycine cleavage system H lipoate-binding protein
MRNNQDNQALSPGAQMMDVFGFQVPISDYYLHRGHAWAVLEDTGLVRVGMDDFSQKVLGPADELKVPAVGMVYYQDHICMALLKQGQKASFLAPVDGAIAEVNPKVRENPSLIHDDPYGKGWLLKVMPTNLQRNLANLSYGKVNADWIYQESHRLINLMETEVGVTVPDGGAFVDDVYAHYPQLGWRRLVQEFLLTSLTKDWKKRS